MTDVDKDLIAEAEQQHVRTMHRYQPLYRTWCLPSREWQRVQLEKLRAKYAYKGNFRFMQGLGDFGREHKSLIQLLMQLVARRY